MRVDSDLINSLKPEDQTELIRILNKITKSESVKKISTGIAVIAGIFSISFGLVDNDNPLIVVGLLLMALSIIIVLVSTIRLNKQYNLMKRYIIAKSSM